MRQRTTKCLSLLFTLALIAAPLSASAAIKITNVQYDPPGSDQGREWIELTNTGSDAIDIGAYRLSEAGTNHKVTVVHGTTSISAGGKAILTGDPDQYLADNPSFVGAVFKCSFSLSNSGETVVLKDARLQTIDTYSYTAPPVVKEAPQPKASKSTTKKISSKKSAGYPVASAAAAEPQTYLGEPIELPEPKNDVLPMVASLVGVLILGAAGALYMRHMATKGPETQSEVEKFDIS